MQTEETTLTAAQPSVFAEPHVIVHGTGDNFVQQISAGDHQFRADEPTSFGGTDVAPDPYDYLMASLGACTSMMVGLQARKRKWPLQDIHVSLRHSKIDAKNCEECRTENGIVDRIELGVELTGPLTAEQQDELMKTAATCPIHRALKGEINVRLCPVNGIQARDFQRKAEPQLFSF